jgi:hypothetical protein
MLNVIGGRSAPPMTLYVEFPPHLPDSYRFNFLVIRYDRRRIPFGVNIRRAGAGTGRG